MASLCVCETCGIQFVSWFKYVDIRTATIQNRVEVTHICRSCDRQLYAYLTRR